MNPKTKKILIISTVVVLLAIIGFIVFIVIRVENVEPITNNEDTITTNINNESSANDNINNGDEAVSGTASTNEEVIIEGTVFVKGYNTPSESFGILATSGYEIGLQKYDSMKEQFRPYRGEKVTVTFERICKSSNEDCCRTLFYYCGTVKSWEPLEEE
ncbi:hypothetical protein KKF61_00480 [Patescibacteria group bacterium]|nr:hypothetical protein [Patescibacteria group bacterium]MBU0964531.1 hypothetical protein [Patescibacteria group bacterium]